MPTELTTSNNLSKGTDNIASMPMVDYNKNSSVQAKSNEPGNQLLKESAESVVKNSSGEFHVADFGCSHGKNSMDCIKAVLDGIMGIKDPIHIMAYLNDLPMNDFGEVFKCLNDPSLSYNEHNLFNESQNANISTMVSGKSFNSQVFPKNQLDLGFCFNCLHWLEKPFTLSLGIIPKSCLSTPEEQAILSKNAHEQLVDFLNYRSLELKSNGRLVFSIIKESPFLGSMDLLWKEFVKSKGFELSQFEPVAIPMYSRNEDEVNAALDQAKDKYNIIHNEAIKIPMGDFNPDMMRAVFYNVVLKGVKSSKVFSTREEEDSFINDFFGYYPVPEGEVYHEFQLVALERL